MQNTQGAPADRSADTCARCGAQIDRSRAAYAAEGMICRSCEADHALHAADVAARSAVFRLGPRAWGLLGLALLSLIILILVLAESALSRYASFWAH